MSEPPPAPAASALATEGPEEKEERSPGGARPAAEDVVSESDPGEKKADPKQFLTPPAVAAGSKKNISSRETTGAAVRRKSQESPRLSKSPRGPSPKRLSPCSSPRNDHAMTSFSLSPRLLGAAPQAKRRSLCRSSLKGIKCRKSLPPVHQDVTELSKSISLDLPEVDRLSMLLLSCFQFSAQKLEHILKQNDDFNPEAFKAHVDSVSEDMKRYLQKLKLDGTLRRCVEDPKEILPDSALDESVAQIKEHIARFSAECQSWDQLLLRYQESAKEMSRRLEQCGSRGGWDEPVDCLRSSQAHVLRTKPDYRRVLEEQRETLSLVELVLDEIQQTVKLLRAFTGDSQQFLQRLSRDLATGAFQQLEKSPVRKLISAPPRGKPPAEGARQQIVVAAACAAQ